MAKQSKAQKETVARVMHEFKHGELETHGETVENPKQAIAIALSEAGSSNQQSPKQNRERLKRTKSKERRGETAKQAKVGKGATGRSKAELYELAKKRDVPGRSKMSKEELARAVGG